MTQPDERTRAILHTKYFLERLLDPKASPRVPRWVRGHAKYLLRPYPGRWDMELAHHALPWVYGPVPLAGTGTAPPASDAASTANEVKED